MAIRDEVHAQGSREGSPVDSPPCKIAAWLIVNVVYGNDNALFSLLQLEAFIT